MAGAYLVVLENLQGTSVGGMTQRRRTRLPKINFLSSKHSHVARAKHVSGCRRANYFTTICYVAFHCLSSSENSNPLHPKFGSREGQGYELFGGALIHLAPHRSDAGHGGSHLTFDSAGLQSPRS